MKIMRRIIYYILLFAVGFISVYAQGNELKIIKPKCGDVALYGDSLDIEWQGILPSDTINLEYSTDNGKSWRTIARKVGGLKYNWYPDFLTDNCLIRALQFWPTSSSGDIILKHNSEVNSANFSSDGSLVVTSSNDNTARIWDVYSGDELRTLSGHTQPLTWAVFSPDTQYVATSSKDSTVKLWETYSGNLIRTFNGHGNIVKSCNFSPDSKKLVTASLDGYAIVWDVETGTVYSKMYSGNSDMLWYSEFDPSGNFILTAGTEGIIKIWDYKTNKIVRQIVSLNSSVSFARFAPDGNRIAGATWKGPAYVWDKNGNVITQVIHSDSLIGVVPINSVAFNPAGDSIITAGAGDFLVKIWSADSGKLSEALRGHTNAVQTAFFSPDGNKVLTSSWDSTARIWNLYTRIIQSDTIVCPFRIAKPVAEVKDVDYGRVAVGENVDSTINSLFLNKSDFAFRIKKIVLTGANPADFQVVNFAPTAMVDSLSGLNYEINFLPSDTGMKTAELEFFFGKDTLIAHLTGNAFNPPLKAQLKEIVFGSLELGQHRDTTIQSIVKNMSDSSINITKITQLGTDSSNFQIISGENPVLLSPGDTLPMTLRFEPLSIGLKVSRLSFEYQGMERKCEVTLRGTGIEARRDTGTLFIWDYSALAGDVINVQVLLKDIKDSIVLGRVDTIKADLSFNSTLLEPLNSFQSDNIQNYLRTVSLVMPVRDMKDSVLTEIQFRTGLGNDTATALELRNVELIGKGLLSLNVRNGTFVLNNVCRQGGERLFFQDGFISLSQNMPNPAGNTTKIDFEVAEAGVTRIYIVDILGNVVKTLVNMDLKPGHYELELNVSDLPSGVYSYILQTPTIRLMRRMDINK
jgi:WD40 repeat protein